MLVRRTSGYRGRVDAYSNFVETSQKGSQKKNELYSSFRKRVFVISLVFIEEVDMSETTRLGERSRRDGKGWTVREEKRTVTC